MSRTEMLPEQPLATAAKLVQSVVQNESDDPSRDRALLTEALRLAPGFRPAAIRLARLLENTGDRDGAWLCLANAAKQNPKDRRISASLLRLALRTHRLREANEIIASLGDAVYEDIRLFRATVDVLMSQCRFADAECLALAALTRDEIAAEALSFVLKCAMEEGRLEDAERHFTSAPEKSRADPRVRCLYAEARLMQADYAGAGGLAAKVLADLQGVAADIESHRVKKWRDRAQPVLDQIAAYETAQEILRRTPQPLSSKARGLLVVLTRGSPQITFLTTLPVLEMMRKGYQAVFLSAEGLVQPGPTGNVAVDAIEGLIASGGLRLKDESENDRPLAHEWEVDWPNRRVVALGMNFFQPIFESMSNSFRRFSIDADTPEHRPMFEHLLRKCDAMLAACRKIHDEIARPDFPIRILAGAPHLVPNAVAAIYCAERGAQSNMCFVNFMPSYEHYFENFTKLRTTKVSVENLTKYAKEQRMPIFPRRDQLERWLARGQHKAAIEAQADRVLAFERARKAEFLPEAMAALERAEKARAANQPVICIFGKITFDVCEPEQGGPAHRDIKDWINDTVRAARSSDALVLIKPHPNEVHQTFGYPTEYFVDLIDEQVPDNVILCGNRWFNMGDLIGKIDLGIVWAGTSALELGAAGIPCVVCNHWGARDHPVDFPVPRDRRHYHATIADPRAIRWPEESRRRCMQIIAFLSTEEVMIPYGYADMPLRRAGKQPKIWNHEALERYFAEGDPAISRITDRIEKI